MSTRSFGHPVSGPSCWDLGAFPIQVLRGDSLAVVKLAATVLVVGFWPWARPLALWHDIRQHLLSSPRRARFRSSAFRAVVIYQLHCTSCSGAPFISYPPARQGASQLPDSKPLSSSRGSIITVSDLTSASIGLHAWNISYPWADHETQIRCLYRLDTADQCSLPS